MACIGRPSKHFKVEGLPAIQGNDHEKQPLGVERRPTNEEGHNQDD